MCRGGFRLRSAVSDKRGVRGVSADEAVERRGGGESVVVVCVLAASVRASGWRWCACDDMEDVGQKKAWCAVVASLQCRRPR